MHHEHFDQGVPLLQTPHPGIKHECKTVEELSQKLAPEGARLLVQGLTNRSYLNGSMLSKPQGSQDSSTASNTAKTRPAPKIKTVDRFIDWKTWDSHEIIRKHRVIGPLWSLTKADEYNPKETRVIWSTGFEPTTLNADTSMPLGQPVVVTHEASRDVQVRTNDQTKLKIGRIKIQGFEEADPIRAVVRAGTHNPEVLSLDGRLFRTGLDHDLPEYYRDGT